MLLLYLLYHKVDKDNKISTLRGCWLFVTGVLYLIPLRSLKTYLQMALRHLNLDGVKWYGQLNYYNERMDALEWEMLNQTVRSHGYQIEVMLFTLWVSVAVGVLFVKVINSLRYRGIVLKECWMEEDPAVMLHLQELKTELRIHRNVRLYYYMGKNPMSFGICRPIILMPHMWKGSIPEAVLRHEMVHIKYFDTIGLVITHIICSVHWFNPMAYIFQHQVQLYFECRCDFTAIKNCSPKEKSAYVSLLVDASRKYQTAEEKMLDYSNNLLKPNKSKRQLQERIYMVMDYKKKSVSKWRKSLGAAALVLAMSVSSMTALAYNDVEQFKATEENVSEDVEVILQNDSDTESWFSAEMISVPVNSDNVAIVYDEQFTDEQGNVFEVNQESSSYVICNHTYIAGYYTMHSKFSDGSCEVNVFNAEKCKWCDLVIIGSKISTSTYVSCSH